MNNKKNMENIYLLDNQNKVLNFIYNKNNRIFYKESPENENNSFSKINTSSNKKDIVFKLSCFSQEDQSVKFSSGIEEIYEDPSNDIDDRFIFKISSKKYSTPPRNSKSSYKKTKEHIKTPYKTTKSRSSQNKSKNNIENYKNINYIKSSNYWKSLLDNEINKYNNSQELNLNINTNCKSVIIDNPFLIKKEHNSTFYSITLEENDEELNKSF